MKVLSLQSANKPKIENGTQTVRMKFQKARLFLNPVNLVIQIGFKHRKNKGTAIGRAMAFTLHSAMEGAYPNISVNPAKARLSIGVKGNLHGTSVSRSGNSISMSWDPQDVGILSIDANDDRVLLCAYAIDQELAAINEEEIWRSHGQLLMDLPHGMHGLKVHLYLIVHDRTKQNCSNSRYLGVF